MDRRDLLKLGSAVAASAVFAPIQSAARISTSDISVRWLGGAMLELRIGDIRILTDPCLGDGKEAFEMGDPNEMFDLSKGPNIKMHERLTSFPGMVMPDYDVVLLSHTHEDHFDQKAQAWFRGKGPILCPAHDMDSLTKKGIAAQALDHGEERILQGGNTEVSIMSVPAVHSLNQGISDILGPGNGYWLKATIQGRAYNIYWAGDTFMVDPVWQAIQHLPTPDLFIPHIGNVGITGALGQLSMNGKQAVEFATRIRAGMVLPIHHSTYALYLEPVSRMIEAHEVSGNLSALHVLGEGAAIAL